MRTTPSCSRNADSRRSRRRRAPPRRIYPVPRRRPGPATAILRGIGAATLVSGWIAAGLVVGQSAAAPDTDAVEYQIVEGHVYPLTLMQSKRERQFVQRMDGDMGLWFAEFDVGLRSLLRPPRLAWTLLVLSTAIGAAFLELAKLSAEDIDD